MDRGAWWAIVHRVAKSQTRLKLLSTAPKIYSFKIMSTSTSGLYFIAIRVVFLEVLQISQISHISVLIYYLITLSNLISNFIPLTSLCLIILPMMLR